MKRLLALLMIIGSGLFAYFSLFPDWDVERHQALQTGSALKIASRELVRVARKRGETATDAALVGEPCLVSRIETPTNKHYVFEFRRRGLLPETVSVFVSSGPSQLDYAVTGNAGYGPGGLPLWSNPVLNCGSR